MKNNKASLRVQFSGYGHYKIFTSYYGKEITCITTNMPEVDNFQSEDSKRINAGYNNLRSECIRKHLQSR
jgi:hypothetical protein